jgi:photosystem II stability/assembly factor-like uncharacterized protein
MNSLRRLSAIAAALVVLTAGASGQTDFWTPTAGPYGGNVRSMAVAPSGTIWAGTQFGGIYSSTNGGATWVERKLLEINNENYAEVRSMVITPGGVLLTGTVDVPWGVGAGVFRTTDNGATWSTVNTGLATTHREVPALAVASGGDLYAGTTRGGVYRSTSAGATWTRVWTGVPDSSVRSLAVSSTGAIFAGTQRAGLYQSTNNGTSWTPVGAGINGADIRTLALTLTALYAGTASGVFRSTNNGGTWTTLNNGLTNTNVVSLYAGSAGLLLAGTDGGGIFRSTNDGASWTDVSGGLGAFRNVWAFANTGTGQIYAGTWGGGIFRSTDDGATWSQAPMTNTWIYSIAATPSGSVFAGGYDASGVYRTTNNGVSWQSLNTGLSGLGVTALAVDDSGSVLLGTGNYSETGGAVYRSTNSGTSWTAVSTGLPAAMVHAFAVNASGHYFAGTVGSGVYRSTNRGANWSAANGGLGSPVIRSLLATPGNLFAATGTAGVYRSTDNGGSWSPVGTGIANPRTWALAANQAGAIVVGTGVYGDSGLVYRSTNNGASWTRLFGQQSAVWGLAFNPSGHLYVGTYGNGLFRSTNNGSSFEALPGGIFNNNFYSRWIRGLAVTPSGFVFAATEGNGVFRSALTTPVRDDGAALPQNVALEQNFPNPFNPSTTIRFQLPESRDVLLQVFDLLGREVATLADGRMAAGSYSVRWDAGGLASGVYLYRLQTEGFVVTKRLMLVR